MAVKSRREKRLSSRGGKLFLFGVIVSLALSVLIRVNLSPSKIEKQLVGILLQADLPFRVQFDQVELNFARGFLPRLSLGIENLRVTGKSECSWSHEVLILDLYVPLRFFESLSESKLRFAGLEMDQIRLLPLDERCEKKSSSSKAKVLSTAEEAGSKVDFKLGAALLSDDLVRRLARQKRDQTKRLDEFWSKIYPSIAQVTPYLKIKQLWLPYDRGDYVFKDFLAEFDRDQPQLSVQADWIPQYSNLITMPSPEVGLEVQLTPDAAKVVSKSRYQGGRGQVTLDVLPERIKGEVLVDHWPLQPFLEQGKSEGLVASSADAKLSWMSCRASIVVDEYESFAGSIALDECGFKGELGEGRLRPVSLTLRQPQTFEQLQVDLSEIDLKKLLHLFKWDGPSGLFTHFGFFSGRVDLKKNWDFDVQWTLRKVRALFSKDGQRVQQFVPEARGAFAYNKRRFSGLITEAGLEGGAFKGEVSFNFDRYFHEGLLQLKVDEIAFAPAVQKEIFGGEIQGASVFGQFGIREGQVTAWKGNVGIQRLAHQGLDAERVRIDSWMQRDQSIGAKVRADQVELSPQSPLLAFQKVYPQAEPFSTMNKVEKVSALFLVKPGHVDIKRFRGLAPGATVTANGDWTKGKGFGGVFRILQAEPYRRFKFAMAGDESGLILASTKEQDKKIKAWYPKWQRQASKPNEALSKPKSNK